MEPKKLLFITGTRADFGKMKSVMQAAFNDEYLDPHVFVTGMHLIERHGLTVQDIQFSNVYRFENHTTGSSMDRMLASTVSGLTEYVGTIKPHMIIVHGDRVETLAGAIVGSLNNILVTHFEGGEVTGTIDDSLRHSVTKLSHIHLVSNNAARERILQLGEKPSSVRVIGAPEVDALDATSIENLEALKQHYNIAFENYCVLIFHPVTTEVELLTSHCKALIKSLESSQRKYVVISPNNDFGNEVIREHYRKLQVNANFVFLKSLPFEHYLCLLKGAELIIGNSSSGVKEAPYLGVASVNIGTRQNNRVVAPSITNCSPHSNEISSAIRRASSHQFPKSRPSGGVGAARKFVSLLKTPELWCTNLQKSFHDRPPVIETKTASAFMNRRKTAVVTGAARGIGLSVSRYLLQQGRQVMMVDIDELELKRAHAELNQSGRPVEYCICDISKPAEIDQMVGKTVLRFNAIDILINNGAMTFSAPVSETSFEEWTKVQSVNLTGAYSCVKQCLPYLIEGEASSVVNVTSIQGVCGQAYTSAYSAAKGGLIAMTKSMAVEFGEHNIRVNAVAPGFIQTNMSYSQHTGKYKHEEEAFKTVYIDHAKLPLRRPGYPEDIAGSVHFLSSSPSAYITGQVIVVDGGVTSTY